MNKHLKQLIEIAQIDKESDAFEPMIKEKTKTLNALLASQDQQKSAITAIAESKDELKLAIVRNELSIQENSQKIEEIAQKTKEVRSDREARALAIEEDLAREQIKHANSEIERLNKELESKEQEQAQKQAKQDELQAQIQELQVATDAEVKRIREQQHEIFLKKEKAIASIDQKVIIFYEKIRKWAKNTSVVPVKKQACGGCFIRINNKLYTEILQSNDIITCPHCGRILYIEENV
ncbi:zinc ribbon domain-containing protein [Helicobacter fennelliae]|uniref:C4-type zinc ribbon domain-containing protein n=1 Tax=Helicobacter fennelliae MRY12-0050 TaxID=1325130 RepID=T1CZC2_9HELI|nr:C4-type zinc ribbon domain-containing protein [Helicobacter fennelliae]GAD19285.1 hypothetical protein HFN_0416 [Helicobacter fennelliae MRY12-0050]STP08342.1 putative zinc ribbon domain-containing protein [Helicobacter fennelliae]